ncbi:hypothetical protein MTR67_026660 [Solanum verrucosum]|uniref:Uncharacterized protein n=1 Tax=Solanum verrucosum TaxID=315347 RepID=A0AAF0R2P6_SOLVR|nr:hypothetical protein MTR67_026660 [Solanum verrucosum]
MVFIFPHRNRLLSMPMLIGQVTPMIASLSQVTLFIWAQRPSPGVIINNLLYFDPPLRLNIVRLLPTCLKRLESLTCSKIFMCHSMRLP